MGKTADINASIRERIAALEKQRHGMSHGSIDYARVNADIQTLAAQLQPEPPPEPSLGFHFKSIVVGVIVGVLVTVISVLVLFYFFDIKG